MGSRREFLTGACALGLASCATGRGRQALALLGGSIVDPGRDAPHVRADVLVEDDRIRAVGPGLRPPAGVRVIDASGKFLCPGLWDMHAHIATAPPIGRAPENYVGWGVLGIRDCGGDLPALLGLRREIAAGRIGPELYIAGPTLNGEQSAPFHRVVADAEQARAAVRELKAAGVDFIKTHRATSRDAFFAMVDEATRQGLSVAGHVPLQVTWEEAAAAGMRSFEHTQTMLENEVSAGAGRAASVEAAVARFDGARLNEVAATLARAGAYFDPTLIQYRESINNRPDIAARRREIYDQHLKRYVARFHEAGVPLLSGSDVLDRFGEMELGELGILAECGLSPRQALRAATTTPVRLMRRHDLAGLRPGALASFLALDADPDDAGTEGLRRLSGVVLRGRFLDEAALATLRQA